MAAANDTVDEPASLLCPITLMMYRDPVVAAESGQTYERWAILEHWRRKKGPHDPLSNLWLKSGRLSTDWSKRQDVNDFLAIHPSHVPDGWSDRKIEAPQEAKQWTEIPNWRKVPQRYVTFFIFGALLGCACRLLVTITSNVTKDAAQLVHLLRMYQDSAWVVQHACSALATLALHDSSKKSLIVEAGAVSLIVKVMELHVNESGVQFNACAALANIAHQNGEAVAKIGHPKGLQSILQVFRHHSKDADVVRNACAAIEQIACADGSSRAHLAALGAIQCITSAMRAHPERWLLHVSSCAALECLALDAVNNHEGLILSGAIEQSVLTAQRFIEQPLIQGHVASMFANIAQSHQGRLAVEQAGGIDCLVQALRQHTRNSWVQGHACSALATLTLSNGILTTILDSGALPLVYKAIEDNPDDVWVRGHACSLLSTIASQRSQEVKAPIGVCPNFTGSHALHQEAD